ncbi:MAG: hypothetical protein AAGC46_16745 [Solirubrobacteraceae bacterium]
MAQQTPRTHIIKRVTLPSGKQLDVVSFVGEHAGAAIAPTRTAPLACCPSCGHDRVQPTSWNEVGNTHWHVNLRCPDCEDRREAIFGQDELDEFDVALDEGTRAVAADLDLLSRANMADDIDRFCKALDLGHIMPEDF